MENIQEKEFLINRLLPRTVKNFFFFDGEQLDDFFKQEKTAIVRDAILDVSQLSLLDKGIDHLDKEISSMRSETKGQSPKGDEIKERIEAIEKSRDDLRKKKQVDEESLSKIKDELADISRKIGGYNAPLVKELENRRDQTQKEIETLEPLIQEEKSHASDKIIDVGPLIYARDHIIKANELIAKKANKGEIPPRIKETFVTEILERGECICGNDIAKDGEAKSKITRLLTEVHLSQISEEVLNLKYELNPMLKLAQKFTAEQDKCRNKIARLEKDLDDARVGLREVQEKMAGINLEEVANLEIARQKLEKRKDELVGDISVATSRIGVAIKQIEELNRDWQRETDRSKALQHVAAKMKLARDTLDVLNKAKQKLVDDIRRTIEEKTEKYFLSLIWKKNFFRDVLIGEDYSISVINNVGSECLGTLSAGEREVLALSFLAALREVSGFDAPVVIDTPLGRISKEPKENIAESLPGFLRETQLTLLVTEEEYTRQVRERLLPKLASECELAFDAERSQTTVKTHARS
jgi:DNA sulfur modification protein DndD